MNRRHAIRSVWVMALAGLVQSGCGNSEKPAEAPAKPHAGKTLKVGVMGDPGLIASVRAQVGEWSAATSATLNLAEKPVGIEEAGSFDALIYPAERMGDLTDRDLLLVWSEDEIRPAPKPLEAADAPAADKEGANTPPPDTFGYHDVVAAHRDQVSRQGTDRVALPIGGTALVLIYQRNAFESEANLAAAKSANIKLEVPKTWEDLDALAKFFQGRDWSGDGKPDHGIALAWGKDTEQVATTTYLARAASLGQHKDQYSFMFDSDVLGPRLTSPPFVAALSQIVELAKQGPENAKSLDIVGARKAFRDGKVAMLIDRAEAYSQWSGDKPTPLGVAALPGSPRVFDPFRKEWETPTRPNRPSFLPTGGGWVVSVLKGSSEKDAAKNFAKYLAGPDTTNRIRSDKTFPMIAVRSGQLGQGIADPRSAPGVDARAWADAVGQTLNAVRVVPGLRIPEAPGYLDDLAKGITAAVNGKAPAEALADVAKAWDARTDRLGRDRQVWHYRRGLNSLVTTPEPPPRVAPTPAPTPAK